MTRKIAISQNTIDNQRRAADPQASIWVAANAGSGKTHVLTQRVLRLLLTGVRPEAILCLTYTKAAAAEMRRRVSEHLSKWALLDELPLAGELQKLEGLTPDADKLRRARTLFAHALETPGGLKIVTIHAFCESVLHRFPMEAGVPFDFSVIEEDDKANMVLGAREAVLAGGLKGDPETADAVATLFARLTDFQITDAIDTALAQGRKLKPLLADRAGAKQRLRKLVGDGPDLVAIDAATLAERLLDAADLASILSICPPKPDANRFEDRLARLGARPSPAAWSAAFLTADQTVPKTFPKAAFGKADPALAERLAAEAERLAELARQRCRALLVARSEAVLDVLGAIFDRYEAHKRARSLLDFDDLIERLGALFADTALGPWVQYKLDAGITHILVDESQDTNAEQWQVVSAIAAEFFTGASAVDALRTVFAVGDEKQSIYSFQGADPRLFAQSGRDFQKKALAVRQRFELVPLHTSFRTLRPILEAVDTVFARTDLQAAVLAPPDQKVHHDSARREPTGGSVTLWPPVQQLVDAPSEAEWPLEAPEAIQSAQRQVAGRIAGEIAAWVNERRPLGPRGRAVSPDDVLILVQSRNGLFFEIIRALMAAGLPTPGADRLDVTGHIGVLDLLALCDVLLNPDDDLQLAALLRSPLFDLTEDELFAIAHGRTGSLWSALRGAQLPAARAAAAQMARWRGRLDFDRPFTFLSHVLYAQGGLKRFHGRMGPEVEDVFSQLLELALAHEQTSQPSLQGFVAAMRARQVSIKRELGETGSGVRVMTVHGAKGLEAPIVILADAATKPEGALLNKSVYLADAPHGPLLVHGARSEDHVPATERLRDADQAAQREEYWRKLYVAMTRAEDELYITGALTPVRGADRQLEGTWYSAVAEALAPSARIETNADGEVTALVYPDTAKGAGAAPQMAFALNPPPVRSTPRGPVPAPPLRQMIRPSSAHDGPVAPLDALAGVAEAAVDPDLARREGIALHALLQHLGGVERGLWPAVSRRALEVLLPGAADRHADLADKAVRLLTRPELAPIFSRDSRAEVPFLLDGRRAGKPVRLAGRIDRLVVTGDSVTVIDYKSDARPPESPDRVAGNYLTQLGLYALVARQLFPGREVRAAFLWTQLESLMYFEPSQWEPAVADFTLE